MRWFWIDRFTEFVRDTRAVTIKHICFGEEAIDDYLPGHPHYPHSLMIEGMAQTGGLLVSEAEGFTRKTVLAKISKAQFFQLVRPGDTLRLTASVQDKQPSGAVIHGQIHVGETEIAEMELWFAFLDERYGKTALFTPDDLLRTLRVMRMFDVAVDQNGNRIHAPAHMLEAERQAAEAIRASL
ncbi:MAG: 3-hydroxyacyl-ACP dehydratase FabZ family protein [Planctomycetota bacterium]